MNALRQQVWRECCVRGNHVYIDVWDTSMVKSLSDIVSLAIQMTLQSLLMVAMTKKAQQDMGVLDYAVAKPSCHYTCIRDA